MNKMVKYFIILLLIMIGGIIFYNKIYVPKTTYKTILPTLGEIEVKVFGIGNVGAKNTYLITAQTGGKILTILTDEGQWVKKGELLITMDTVDLPQLLDEAKISVKKANSELVASKKEKESLLAQKHLALITYNRYAKLKKQSFASQSEYDKAKADLDVIEAQSEAIQAHINSAKIEIERAKKALDALSIKLSRYKIYSPVDGYVIAREAEVSQSITSTQNILKIVNPNNVWIKAYIDEKISGNIAIGQNAIITLRSQKDKKYNGTVKRIVAQTDAVTQEKEINISFTNLPIPFYINEQAEVLVTIKKFSNLIKIPSNLLIYIDDEVGVWIDKDHKAHYQKVDVIARGENEVGVSGINQNTKLLVTSKDKKSLKEGMSIH